MRSVLDRIAGAGARGVARVGSWAVRRPAPVLAAAALLVLLSAIAALRLDADRSPEALVEQGSETFAATQDYEEDFGDDPVYVLVRGDLRRLLLTDNIQRLVALEACLGGKAPGGRVLPEQPAPAPCAELAELRPAQAVYGAATFLNQFAEGAKRTLLERAQLAQREAQLAAQQAALRARRQGLSEADQQAAADAAYRQVLTRLQAQLLELAVRYGQSGVPRLDDPVYVSSVVFDPAQPGGTPKSRFGLLFPSPSATLIQVRLRSDLTTGERERAIELIREATGLGAFSLDGGEYAVSGVPVVFDALAQEVSEQAFVLLGAALVVMTITLALVLGPPLRLLPLAIALGAVALTFGAYSLVGDSVLFSSGELTMASIAVLPVLIGLAVDYAIQFHARFTEGVRGGASPRRAALRAARRGAPVIAVAALATVAGFAVLLLSPIPMVRDFGALLVVGVALAFALALTVGIATLGSLSRSQAGGAASFVRPLRVAMATARGAPSHDAATDSRPADRGPSRQRDSGGRLRELGRRALAASLAAPGRVLAVAVVIAVAGWFAGTRVEVISDIRELVPRSLPALEDVDEFQEATGASGEIAVAITGRDVSDPEVVSWMRDFKARILAEQGYEQQLCAGADSELCPAFPALSDIFSGEEPVPSAARVRGVLELMPRYFRQALVNTDPRTGFVDDARVISLGIKVMPFDDQKELIDEIDAAIDGPGAGEPPAGVDVEVVGLPVLAAEANAELSANRYLLTGAGLAAVALVLVLALRSATRALVPLIPIVLATGWSSLLLGYLPVGSESTIADLNPMSATLGALVIAIATEFSVLLSARYYEERGAGGSVGESLRLAYSRTGTAVAASGVTAIAGFAVLLAPALLNLLPGVELTDIRMLHQFGLVTVFDLGVALAGVLLVLPAALVWAEGGFEPLPSLAARLRRGRRSPPAESRAVP